MAKRKQENFDDDEAELANMFGDADSSPPTKRAMTPAEAWDAIEEKNAALRKSQTPISELDKVPTMEEITKGPEPNGPEQNGGKRKMRKTGKARKMKTKKSSKSRTRKSTRRHHKTRRTR